MRGRGGMVTWLRLLLLLSGEGCKTISRPFATAGAATKVTSVGHNPWVSALASVQRGQAPRIKVRVKGGGGKDLEPEQLDLSLRGFFEEGRLCDVVEALDLVVQRSAFVSHTHFYRVLKRCIADRNLDLGKRVHALSLRSGYESNTFLANHIIRMYASHGKLEEAMQVFSVVTAPDMFMWHSIISGFAEHGQFTQAVELYHRMRTSGIKPNNYVYVVVLKVCSIAGDLASGKNVHADILRSGDVPDVFVGSCLVDMYAKCGELDEARGVFNSLSQRNVVTWTAMISGYAEHGFGQEALSLYASMLHEGVTPDDFTFASVLKACGLVRDLHRGKQLHVHIQESGVTADVVVGNCLIEMYAKCESVEDAQRVFDTMPHKDVATWNAMLTGYVEHGLGREALGLHARMEQECTMPSPSTFASLIRACASIRDLQQGMELHGQIKERGLEGDVVIGSCLVDMYAKCGSLEIARRVFDGLCTRDVVLWTTMIAAYAQNGLGQEALSLYADMRKEGLTLANNVTFVCLLQACASVGALNQGRQVHAEINEQGLEPDLVIGNCLVDMYVKCGRLEEACAVFDRLPTRDVATWTALLKGCAQQNDGKMALDCFRKMQEQGIEPDGATFLCLLVACSHLGQVDEGRRFFQIMVDDRGIAPTTLHYVCMVDLLGRSGHLDEAEDMLCSMPFEDKVVGWICLLSACKSHGDLERGRRCFERVIALEPENASAYALLATMYSSAGLWADAQEIEKLRKLAGAKKKPAKAWIEVENQVHEFRVGEARDDISSKLMSVNLRLKEEGGHVPHTELVTKAVSEAEKEDALCGHAEKLALAYGLLATPDGTPLLVTKNLRMCNDCHSGTKIMSRLERREIVVRDAHRVHRFVDGSCSCGDRH